MVDTIEEDFDWQAEEEAHAREWEEIKKTISQLPEIQQETIRRWTDLEALQEHYVEFSDFLYDAMTEVMGFDCTEVQIDIGNFLQYGPQYLMIQAQRSQAKSTIVAIFAVWCLIHNPKARILIVSAGSDVAQEIANYVIQVIMNWEILTCLRPDRQHGDRASAKAFDINWMLKGVEKSPSIACIGITSNMQGRRADILIPDDIESSKNGLTETQRQQLVHKSRDFTSICSRGRIMYLGTPQTNDSIYNTLPGRGFTIRIWPGRYPTEEEEKNYGVHLAPLLRKQMELNPSLRTGGGAAGDSGQPIDPIIMPEETLVAKELDQGEAYFQLQHMLNTKLSDAGRYPLKTKDLIIMPLNPDKAPTDIVWLPDQSNRLEYKEYAGSPELYRPFSIGTELYEYENRYVYVDTSGGGANGDETTAFALNFLHGLMFAMEMLVLPGGVSEENFTALSEFVYRNAPNEIGVEQNHGYGAFAQAWRPALMDFYEEKTGERKAPAIIDDWVSTQKELRIIDTLGPVMARHKLIINESILQYDIDKAMTYPVEMRQIYTLVHQINKITIERGALLHDDRLDALASAVRRYVDRMAVSEKERAKHKASSENIKMLSEWSEEFANSFRKQGESAIHRTGSRSNRSKIRRRRKR